ncbi:hypothetical protein BJX68DRAFT_261682 [Aspergillus pseudodeflectus]|uniref:Uncharacterized protein n=1 Tax=Aspergillus pseudodeflectus TaxID=176178 RepID=A0ABR4L3X7_9EURO
MVPWSGVLNGAVLLAAGCLLSRTTTAAPSGLRFDNSTIWHGSLEVRDTDHGPSFSFPGVDLRVEPRAADSFTLRILPLGASITEGYKSSDGTGYRKALRAQLRHAGWSVNMASGVLPVELCPIRHDIILSTLLPNTAKPALVTDINIHYRRIYTRRRDAGDKIVLADMANALEVSDLINNTHPNNEGDTGFLSAPADPKINKTAINNCDKEYGSGQGHYAQTQRGSGADNLVNVWGAYQEGALHDLFWSREDGRAFMFLNKNNGDFDSAVEIDVGYNWKPRGWREPHVVCPRLAALLLFRIKVNSVCVRIWQVVGVGVAAMLLVLSQPLLSQAIVSG